MKQDEALKMAIEALKNGKKIHSSAILAIEEALASRARACGMALPWRLTRAVHNRQSLRANGTRMDPDVPQARVGGLDGGGS
jgi:hypothetical protein